MGSTMVKQNALRSSRLEWFRSPETASCNERTVIKFPQKIVKDAGLICAQHVDAAASGELCTFS